MRLWSLQLEMSMKDSKAKERRHSVFAELAESLAVVSVDD